VLFEVLHGRGWTANGSSPVAATAAAFRPCPCLPARDPGSVSASPQKHRFAPAHNMDRRRDRRVAHDVVREPAGGEVQKSSRSQAPVSSSTTPRCMTTSHSTATPRRPPTPPDPPDGQQGLPARSNVSSITGQRTATRARSTGGAAQGGAPAALGQVLPQLCHRPGYYGFVKLGPFLPLLWGDSVRLVGEKEGSRATASAASQADRQWSAAPEGKVPRSRSRRIQTACASASSMHVALHSIKRWEASPTT